MYVRSNCAHMYITQVVVSACLYVLSADCKVLLGMGQGSVFASPLVCMGTGYVLRCGN